MRVLRTVLILALVIVVGLITFGWWSGAGNRRASWHPDGATAATTGASDTSAARERGAEVGEKAARATAVIRETMAEAALTSKIKAKMALDDNVRARSIDVTTTGSTVRLTGTVRSNAERERAVRLAGETVGVSRVIDHLDVQP